MIINKFSSLEGNYIKRPMTRVNMELLFFFLNKTKK